jgi:hypothetical protein
MVGARKSVRDGRREKEEVVLYLVRAEEESSGGESAGPSSAMAAMEVGRRWPWLYTLYAHGSGKGGRARAKWRASEVEQEAAALRRDDWRREA